MFPTPLRRAGLVPPVLLLALVSLVPLAASADSPTRLEPVVVTATRLPIAASTVLSDLVVIDTDTIRAAGTSSLAELLQSHAGAEIAANGGPGQTAGIFLRATNANHVVLLIDGVRVNSASVGTNAFENLPLAQIERIEIRRGPASSLYGADAIGGVIQVFTRQGPRSEAALGVGTWRTYEASAGVGRAIGATVWSVQVGATGSSAFSATNPANVFSFDPDRDSTHNRHVGLSVAHAFAPGHTLAARALRSDRTTRFDSGADLNGQPSDDLNRQRLASVSVESRNRVADGWDSRLLLARGTDDGRISGVFPSVFRTDQDQALWQNDVDALGGRLALGAEWRRERVASDTPFAVDRRSIRSVFASHAAQWGAHLLQASVRRDSNSQFGARTTGNAAYGWQIAPAWRVSGSAGTAFKAPSFNDLYYASPFFSGNPDLRPERSRSAEAALRYDDGRLRAGLVNFESRISDLIAVDSSFTTVDNVARARIRGSTASAALRAGVWDARIEWTHQSAVNSATGTRLVRRARDHGTAAIAATWGAWRAGIDMVASGARFDAASNDPASRMGGYGLVNVHAAYRLTPEWTLSARFANAGNKAYEQVRGYNTAGRNAFVSLAYRSL